MAESGEGIKFIYSVRESSSGKVEVHEVEVAKVTEVSVLFARRSGLAFGCRKRVMLREVGSVYGRTPEEAISIWKSRLAARRESYLGSVREIEKKLGIGDDGVVLMKGDQL